MTIHNSDSEVLDLLKDGYDVTSIASRLGVSEIYVRKTIDRHNISYSPDKSDLFKYGMTDDSHALRVRLGFVLYNLFVKNGSKAWTASRLTGLNRYELKAAMGRPWSHDWTISQMERVCRASDYPMSEIFRTAKK